MEKQEVLDKIEKFDLTEEQLERIEEILSGKFPETYNYEVIEVIKENKKKETLYEKKAIEKLIYNIFRVCDSWVDIEVFVRFEDEFSKETRKFGFDLHKIYYGKSFAEMKKKYTRYNELKKTSKK